MLQNGHISSLYVRSTAWLTMRVPIISNKRVNSNPKIGLEGVSFKQRSFGIWWIIQSGWQQDGLQQKGHGQSSTNPQVRPFIKGFVPSKGNNTDKSKHPHGSVKQCELLVGSFGRLTGSRWQIGALCRWCRSLNGNQACNGCQHGSKDGYHCDCHIVFAHDFLFLGAWLTFLWKYNTNDEFGMLRDDDNELVIAYVARSSRKSDFRTDWNFGGRSKQLTSQTKRTGRRWKTEPNLRKSLTHQTHHQIKSSWHHNLPGSPALCHSMKHLPMREPPS